MKYKGFKIQKVYTIIGKDLSAYDYQFTLKDAKRIIDEREKGLSLARNKGGKQK